MRRLPASTLAAAAFVLGGLTMDARGQSDSGGNGSARAASPTAAALCWRA